MPIIFRVAATLLRYFGRTLLITVPAFLAYEFLLFRKVYAEKMRGYRLDALRRGSPASDPAGSSAKALASSAEFFLQQTGHALKLSVIHPTKIGSDFADAVDQELAKGMNYNPVDNEYIQSSIIREFGINPQPVRIQRPKFYASLKRITPLRTDSDTAGSGEPTLENMAGVAPIRKNPMPHHPSPAPVPK